MAVKGSSLIDYRTIYKTEETHDVAWNISDGFGGGDGSYLASAAGSAETSVDEIIDAAPFEIDLTPNLEGKVIQPGSVNFTWGGVRYVDRLGKIYRNPSPTTGLGAEVGEINYDTGVVTLSTYDSGANTVAIQSLVVRFGKQLISQAVFRTPGAPLRPGSLSIEAVTIDGQQITAQAAQSGVISGDLISGMVDYEKGIVLLGFGKMVTAAGNETQPWYHASQVVNDKVWKPAQVFADSILYVCVVYSSIPLDADLLGLDPVRLPTDGRVPIVKPGYVVVIHNTQTTQLPGGLTAGQQLTLPRPGINHVELYDANEQYVPSTKFAWDEDTKKIIMANPLDLTGFAQPLIAMHRIEDMALVSEVQINGQIVLSPAVSHDYPISGTYVSSALLFGDQQSRYYGLFDQKTWTNDWSDELVGDSANATYNELNYPLQVTNQGAIRERWALVFTAADYFYVMGEHVGIVGRYYITNDCSPINPATNQPFFFLDYRGWGTGWASGNVVRFNTDGASPDLWIARTTLQGPVTEPNDQFTIQIRGDAQ